MLSMFFYAFQSECLYTTKPKDAQREKKDRLRIKSDQAPAAYASNAAGLLKCSFKDILINFDWLTRADPAFRPNVGIGIPTYDSPTTARSCLVLTATYSSAT